MKLKPRSDMGKTLRLLLVEDDEEVAKIVRHHLQEKSQITFEIADTIRNWSDVSKILKKDGIDVLLVDFSVMGAHFEKRLAELREIAPFVPVVCLVHCDEEMERVIKVETLPPQALMLPHMTGPLMRHTLRHTVERARVEEELNAERELLHALLDSLPDRVYYKDRNSRFLRISSAMAQFFGLDNPEEAIGKWDFDYFTEEHAQPAYQDEQEVIKSGKPIVGKIEKETLPDGRIGWVHTTKLPLRNRHNEIVGTFGISRDITDLKHLEDALAHERNLLRNLLDHLPDPVCMMDADGRYVLENLAHARYLGLDKAGDAIGRKISDYFPEEYAAKVDALNNEIMKSRKARVNVEEHLESPSGQDYWMISSRVPLLNEQKEAVGLVCIRRDITSEKQARQELLETNKRLEQTLADLQALQLHLIEAEKMRTVGRLSAGVAHEVKNPLAIISLGVEFLQGQEWEDTMNIEVLHEIEQAVKRADLVVKGLLDFSAPRKLEFELEDLSTILQKAYSLVKGERGSAGIEVEMDFGKVPPLKLDRAKISQVFINLFTNSIHAMEGTGKLTIRTRAFRLTGVGSNVGSSQSETFRAGDKVAEVIIEDTGPGFPPDKISKVFEPFFTTKPTGMGTGLGMTVVQSIVGLHQGTIDISNRKEGGARVRIMFKVPNS